MAMESGTSSSESGSTTTSGSTSCTDTGSSSDSDSSSATPEEKPSAAAAPASKSQQQQQQQTSGSTALRRKATATEAEKPKSFGTTSLTSAASKVRSVAASNHRLTSDDDDEDDTPPPVKKNARSNNTGTAAIAATAATAAPATRRKPPPAIGRAKPPPASRSNNPPQRSAPVARATENGDCKRPSLSSSSNSTDDSAKVTKNGRKVPLKMASTVRAKQVAARGKLPQIKKNGSGAGPAPVPVPPPPISSEGSDSESGTGSGDDSSSGSDSEGSDSSNSYSSQPPKNAKGKRPVVGGKPPRSDSEEERKDKANPMRKLTRSLSMRRSKQQQPKEETDYESDEDLENDKMLLTKSSPGKKPAPSILNSAKSKVKKEGVAISSGVFSSLKSRPVSPITQTEKKCPIEGCDSSGHLSGNLDKHFLPEACPIYHNMSASECKERASERKIRNEQRGKMPISIVKAPGNQHTNLKSLTPEQREFLAKIRESRASFRPINNNFMDSKVKLEKDCTDEDREPSLTGLVPDYDLQLFREAQAQASERIEDELKDLPVGKGIKYISMGKYKMKVWYQSPYPDDAARLPKMYICEFCLRYQKSETGIKRHAEKCVWRHPPGDEIYRKGKLQVWQVDGKRHKQYCQHLCLLAKFFLDHKTLYYDVEPFLFYIMTLADIDGCHIVGYFSKHIPFLQEKNSFYNVSCILTLPPYQRKGYGRLLIDFSYLLTRVEGKIGSPEKPLSDLGLISYRSYWKDVLLDYLCNRSGNTLNIKDVSQEMAIYSYDIVSTLQALGMMKYWKGKHIVLKKQDVLDEYEERVKRRGTFPKIDDSCLRWQPFIPVQPSAESP
ncbi:histone acetyltransferase KAT7 [Drosophila pseudoobscura]|uniref:Histone acetyltransferase n=1 Tax=Drosophila pseudoobscura pseudoobscura TaxID=46245 RepID=A0A6I8ULL0_DROPS|nr:histone acetyltransferase KAT7 [Drosophila pseudoobscura]